MINRTHIRKNSTKIFFELLKRRAYRPINPLKLTYITKEKLTK